MPYLLAITVLWAFSFSLIGVYLAGQVDPWFSVFIRIILATLVFLPFMRFNNISNPLRLKLMAIGAVQLGLMYVFYYHSFLYLTVPEVLLFTILTPVYITLLNDLLDRSFNGKFLISALIAVAGALAIRFENITSDFIIGLLLVQGANLCFAIGQVTYKRLIHKMVDVKQHEIFGWFFVGAAIVATLTYALFGDPEKLPTTTTQWSVLIYLGFIASGIGYFIWNKGATLVDVGSLAVMNNLLVPTGILVNVLIWNKDADLLRLMLGGGIILLALLFNNRFRYSSNT
ncbi:carboxylate/amino acid/amine transporter [uncultured Psychrosphaera sp.]|uniref:carboxylate/amino acid/amine transporter n=1 Tax=uncultured Psychrosphaera sp. TaxID=1403522 RepID=UPI002614F944|nr:carboxylate/amino acid/amine transporter [uncultured Psychrosphaera sp.]